MRSISGPYSIPVYLGPGSPNRIQAVSASRCVERTVAGGKISSKVRIIRQLHLLEHLLPKTSLVSLQSDFHLQKTDCFGNLKRIFAAFMIVYMISFILLCVLSMFFSNNVL